MFAFVELLGLNSLVSVVVLPWKTIATMFKTTSCNSNKQMAIVAIGGNGHNENSDDCRSRGEPLFDMLFRGGTGLWRGLGSMRMCLFEISVVPSCYLPLLHSFIVWSHLSPFDALYSFIYSSLSSPIFLFFEYIPVSLITIALRGSFERGVRYYEEWSPLSIIINNITS